MFAAFFATAALLFAASSPRPTSAALRRAAVLDSPALVEVIGPHDRGAGVVVGRDGTVLTTVDFVGLRTAGVRIDGKRLKAKVVAANARLRLAVLRLPKGDYFAVPARITSRVTRGEWLFALLRKARGRHHGHRPAEPALPSTREVRVIRAHSDHPFFEVNRRLPPGAPLLDPLGRMVALVVAGTRHGARALLLPVVKTELAKKGTR